MYKDTIVVPMDGRGLMAGISIIAKDINPDIKIIGVQAKLSPSMHQTIRSETVFCGGNIDSRLLGLILNPNMMSYSRLLRFRVYSWNEPGILLAILVSIRRCGEKIVKIYHRRMFCNAPAILVKKDEIIHTFGANHEDEIVQASEQQ